GNVSWKAALTIAKTLASAWKSRRLSLCARDKPFEASRALCPSNAVIRTATIHFFGGVVHLCGFRSWLVKGPEGPRTQNAVDGVEPSEHSSAAQSPHGGQYLRP